MTAMTATTTGGSGGFTGADVDGLDKVAQDCTEAAQVVDEVKAALEIIVAASFLFGPFGAAFISYLKTVVIPWLTKISEALKLFAKVLSANAQSQRDASSPTSSSAPTSTPTYQTPSNLPSGSTANYPTMPSGVGGSGGGGGTSSAPAGTGSGASTVSTPPSLGGSTGTSDPTTAAGTTTGGSPTTPGSSTTPGGSTTPQTPFAQDVTALTGLVTAIDHLIHPDSAGAGDPTGGATGTDPTGGGLGGGDLGGTGGMDGGTGTDPTGGLGGTGTGVGTDPTGGGLGGTGTGIDPTGGGTPGTDPTGGTGAGSDPTGGGSAGGTAGPVSAATGHLPHGGMNFHQTGTLPNGDVVGRLSVPAEISPNGQITPLTHNELGTLGGSSGGYDAVQPISSTPASLGSSTGADTVAPLHDTSSSHVPSSGGGASGGLSGGSGGFSGGGATAPQPVSHSVAPVSTDGGSAPTAAHHAAAASHPAASGTGGGSSTNHDGLYAGLGQATGIGAGAGAIAKASLSEAKQAADGALINAADLPFDAGSDAATQGSVFGGTLR